MTEKDLEHFQLNFIHLSCICILNTAKMPNELKQGYSKTKKYSYEQIALIQTETRTIPEKFNHPLMYGPAM